MFVYKSYLSWVVAILPGARVIRCGNGSEFKNKTMNELRLGRWWLVFLRSAKRRCQHARFFSRRSSSVPDGTNVAPLSLTARCGSLRADAALDCAAALAGATVMTAACCSAVGSIAPGSCSRSLRRTGTGERGSSRDGRRPCPTARTSRRCRSPLAAARYALTRRSTAPPRSLARR